MPYTVDEAHLNELLEGAAANIAKGTRHTLRLAALELVDYYHAILKEAADPDGHEVGKSSVGWAVDSVMAHLRLKNVGYLEWLHDLRTQFAHGEHTVPPVKRLNTLLENAVKTREVLKAASAAATARLQGLGEMPKALVQGAEMLQARLAKGSPEWKAKHQPLVERALAAAAAHPNQLDMGSILVLVEVREFLANLKGYEEAWEEMHPDPGEPDDYEPDHDDYPDESEPDYHGEPDYEREPNEEPAEGTDPGDYEPPEPPEPDGEPDHGGSEDDGDPGDYELANPDS